MDTFAILAEPTRRSIVGLVARRGTLTATEIGGRFPSSLPAISQHLKVLRDAEILTVEQRGRERLYSLNIGAIDRIDRWVKETKELWDARLDRLDKLLATAERQSKSLKKSHTSKRSKLKNH
ncbi:MAG TPA: metalloregulator ArsR/SmtB family transcription factor [Candidatus Paceibacterota bacterium]|nr:metalloregulator ArsR/SmtB family transcription factor [Candidatus Paceibacterota bacterium]